MPSTAVPTTVLLILLLPLALLAPSTAKAAPPASCTSLESTVEYLMDQVARSQLIFVRNGKPHKGPEAAEHMRKKYVHFRKDIHTPEDFIRLAATKSLLSGKPYTIVTAEGEEVLTADWLRAALRACRAAAGTPPAEPGRQEP